MRLGKIIISFALIGCIFGIGPVEAMTASSSDIEQQIASYMADLDASRDMSEELESQISEKQKEVGSLYSEVETLNLEKEIYYQEMKQRIAYFYEERQGDSLMTVLMSSESFADFISALQFQQAISDYDSSRMDEYQALLDELDEKTAALNGDLESLGDMVEEQVVLSATLEAAISDKEGELEEAKTAEALAAAKAEAERRAKADAVQYVMSAFSDASSESEISRESIIEDRTAEETEAELSEAEETEDSASENKTSSSSDSDDSQGSDSGDVLTKSKGVIYYNGHRETWYSQKVLPGTGLDIPGRYVDDNGIVRDGDGYICVASSDYSRGTVVETSMGAGKVYDSGCASGTIDIYTNW